MSLKQQIFLDFGENKVSFMKNFVPFSNMKMSLPVPSIKSTRSDIVLIIAFIDFNQRSTFYM